jgi:hypothetical protein
MTKEFVPYEQALELRELGFDEPCFGLYHSDKTFYPTQCKSHEQYHGQICSAPLYQQAFRWFEDTQSMFVEREITTNANEIIDIEYRIKSWRFPPVTIEFDEPYGSFDKNEAEVTCLNKLIEIVR